LIVQFVGRVAEKCLNWSQRENHGGNESLVKPRLHFHSHQLDIDKRKTMSTPSLFYRAIEHVLRNWTALQVMRQDKADDEVHGRILWGIQEAGQELADRRA
jgi:hypothetical protein